MPRLGNLQCWSNQVDPGIRRLHLISQKVFLTMSSVCYSLLRGPDYQTLSTLLAARVAASRRNPPLSDHLVGLCAPHSCPPCFKSCLSSAGRPSCSITSGARENFQGRRSFICQMSRLVLCFARHSAIFSANISFRYPIWCWRLLLCSVAKKLCLDAC